MKNINRILAAVAILMVGTALIPFVELPTETFNWQRYINAYQDPLLVTNHFSGSPGSFFTITGAKFTPNVTATISANGQDLGTVDTDASGALVFLLDSTGADPGYYEIKATTFNEEASVGIYLLNNAPVHPQDGSGPIFSLPIGIAEGRLHMPIITK